MSSENQWIWKNRVACYSEIQMLGVMLTDHMRGKVKHQIGDTTYCEDWKAAAELGNANAAKLFETHCSNIL